MDIFIAIIFLAAVVYGTLAFLKHRTRSSDRHWAARMAAEDRSFDRDLEAWTRDQRDKETCMCGGLMEDHNDMWQGHSPVSMHDYHNQPEHGSHEELSTREELDALATSELKGRDRIHGMAPKGWRTQGKPPEGGEYSGPY